MYCKDWITDVSAQVLQLSKNELRCIFYGIKKHLTLLLGIYQIIAHVVGIGFDTTEIIQL